MDINEVKKNLKEKLVVDLAIVSNELNTIIRYESPIFDEFITYYGRLKKVEKDYYNGIIQREYYDIQINQIREGVLKLLNCIKLDDIHISQAERLRENPQNSIEDNFEMVEEGVFINKNNIKKVSLAPTVFFSNRFKNAFPGVRGFQWINDPSKAVYRLSILLKPPLMFDKWSDFSDPKPIWWFRGTSNSPVVSFKKLSDTKCLINQKELEISRLGVYQSETYYRQFVYIETTPDKQTELYHLGEKDIERMIENFGYAREEYGIINGYEVKREEFDDGAAEIDGQIIESDGNSEQRIKYLSKYNLIISAKFSPYNSKVCDKLTEPIFNGIVKDEKTFNDLIKVLKELPKNIYDG